MNIENPAQLARLSEDEARHLIESIRWPDGPICPHCGSVKGYKMGGKAGAEGRCKCRDCRRKFTIRVGTIFENSPIALKDWVYAFARMCSSKKGISSHQIHRELGITYKSAWFMCHRIRHAMAEDGTIKLQGIIEADEAYVGGKPRERVSHERRAELREKGQRQPKTKKTPVAALVERDGNARMRVVPDVTAVTLKENIREHVDPSASIMTDELQSYRGLDREFESHGFVKHSAREYARGNIHINTAESLFSLLKRAVYGSWHHVSKEHLQRYCDEATFRWNNRAVTDVTRTLNAIKASGGKRLSYKPLTA